MKLLPAFIAPLMLLSLSARTAAQDIPTACSNLTAPGPGEWVEYDVTTSEGAGVLRFALVPNAGSGLLMELTMTTGGESFIMQFDVPGYPYDPSQIRQMVIKAPGQPAMVMPQGMMRRMGDNPMEGPMNGLAKCLEATYVGRETLQAGGSTYDTDHIRPTGADTDVWISADVPFGIVKTAQKGDTMTLRDSGTGAVSSITETPQQMPSLPGMPGRGRIPGIPR